MGVQIFAVSILIVIVLITGVWRKWKSYYNTILFFVSGDLMYKFLFQDRLLWIHKSKWLSDKQIDLVWMFVIYPCTILLFFTLYEKRKSIKGKILTILLWVLIYALWELVLYKYGRIIYKNGWNYYCSLGFDTFMFPILILHHYKPLWAVITVMLAALLVMYALFGKIII